MPLKIMNTKTMKINNIALDQLIDELKQQGYDNEQIYYKINEMLESENNNDFER